MKVGRFMNLLPFSFQANAFEQGGSVHLFACAMLDFDLNFGGKMEGATRPFLTRYVGAGSAAFLSRGTNR